MRRKVPSSYTPEAAFIGDRIREARHALRWSQSVLGEKIGVTFQQVQKYENGSNAVSTVMLMSLAEALGKDVAFFLPLKQNGRPDPALAKFMALKETHEMARWFVNLPSRERAMLAFWAKTLVEARNKGE